MPYLQSLNKEKGTILPTFICLAFLSLLIYSLLNNKMHTFFIYLWLACRIQVNLMLHNDVWGFKTWVTTVMDHCNFLQTHIDRAPSVDFYRSFTLLRWINKLIFYRQQTKEQCPRQGNNETSKLIYRSPTTTFSFERKPLPAEPREGSIPDDWTYPVGIHNFSGKPVWVPCYSPGKVFFPHI